MVASAKTATYGAGARAEIKFHQRSTDTIGITAKDYWTTRVRETRDFEIQFLTAATPAGITLRMSKVGDFQAPRDVIVTRNIIATQAVVSKKGDFVETSDGSQPIDNPLRVMGDNIRITTPKTPTDTADTSPNAGTLCLEANYLYVKTATGWKRVTLTT